MNFTRFILGAPRSLRSEALGGGGRSSVWKNAGFEIRMSRVRGPPVTPPLSILPSRRLRPLSFLRPQHIVPVCGFLSRDTYQSRNWLVSQTQATIIARRAEKKDKRLKRQAVVHLTCRGQRTAGPACGFAGSRRQSFRGGPILGRDPASRISGQGPH